jgi:peroxiredoxin
MAAMTLQENLDQRRAATRDQRDPEQRRSLEEAIERLRMLQIVEQGLAVGDVLPDFALPDADGRIVKSDDLLARGPLALVFFRGPWCPFCCLTLEALEGVRPQVEALGAALVGVAPLTSDALAQLRRERRLGLLLLSDVGLGYAALCGLRFEMATEVKELYLQSAKERGIEILGLTAEAPWELPVPAAYVADQGGIIRFAYGDADWARRAEPNDIVAAAERLSQPAATTA